MLSTTSILTSDGHQSSVLPSLIGYPQSHRTGEDLALRIACGSMTSSKAPRSHCRQLRVIRSQKPTTNMSFGVSFGRTKRPRHWSGATNAFSTNVNRAT